MAIQKEVANPYSATAYATGYIRVIAMPFGNIVPWQMSGKVAFGMWASQADYDAKRPMIASVEYVLGMAEQPAEYKKNADGLFVGADGKVLADQKNVALRVVTRPAVLSLPAFVAKYQASWDALVAGVYAEFKPQPELTGGVDV